MKTPLSLMFIAFCLVQVSTPALAAETYVPEARARALFEASSSLFPEARQSSNHSETVFLSDLNCASNQDEFRCEARTLEGRELVVEGGNPVPEEEEINSKLSAFFRAVSAAGIPVTKGEGFISIELRQLGCEHLLPGDGTEKFACGYER